MRAMLMAAGVGSRLQPLTHHVPKPMVPLANTPAIGHILRLLAAHGVQDVTMNLHYHPDAIRRYVGDGAPWGLRTHFSQEDTLLGTAGGVKRVGAHLGAGGTFLILSGDALTDIELGALLAFHRAKGALATIATRRVQDTTKFGVVVSDAAGRITSFQEKPKPEEALSQCANTGIYVCEPALLARIPADTFYDFGSQLFPALAAEGAPFYAWETGSYWEDVGSLAQYRLSNYDVLDGKVKVALPGEPTDFGAQGVEVQRDAAARIEGRAVLGDGVNLAAGSALSGRCALGDGVAVGAKARLHDAIVWAGTQLGPEVRLEGCVVGARCQIAEGAFVGTGAIISDDVVVEAGGRVEPGVVVGPGKLVTAREVVAADRR